MKKLFAVRPKKRRIEILDAVRGFAILAMVVYHTLYDINDIFGYHIALFDMLSVLEPPFAGAFILLTGVSSRFSHSNCKRGVRILAVGMALTAVTWFFMRDQLIVFGILHFMGCAILLFALLRPALDRIPKAISYTLCIFLFVFTYSLPTALAVGIPPFFSVAVPSALTALPGAFLFGLPGPTFASADYFPLIPWIFLFLLGTLIGIPIRDGKFPEGFYTRRVPFFAFVGRHTLLIYVAHQPIVYGVLCLLAMVFHVRF